MKCIFFLLLLFWIFLSIRGTVEIYLKHLGSANIFICQLGGNNSMDVLKNTIGLPHHFFSLKGDEITGKYHTIEQLRAAQLETNLPVVIAESSQFYQTNIEARFFGSALLFPVQLQDNSIASFKNLFLASSFITFEGREITRKHEDMGQLKNAQVSSDAPVVVAESKKQYMQNIEVRWFGQAELYLAEFDINVTARTFKDHYESRLYPPITESLCFVHKGVDIENLTTMRRVKKEQAESDIPVVIASSFNQYRFNIEVRLHGETALHLIRFKNEDTIDDFKIAVLKHFIRVRDSNHLVGEPDDFLYHHIDLEYRGNNMAGDWEDMKTFRESQKISNIPIEVKRTPENHHMAIKYKCFGQEGANFYHFSPNVYDPLHGFKLDIQGKCHNGKLDGYANPYITYRALEVEPIVGRNNYVFLASLKTFQINTYDVVVVAESFTIFETNLEVKYGEGQLELIEFQDGDRIGKFKVRLDQAGNPIAFKKAIDFQGNIIPANRSVWNLRLDQKKTCEPIIFR